MEEKELEYLEELKSILKEDISNEEKKNKILQYHESDIADLLDDLDSDERQELYKILGVENIADVWSHAEDIEEVVNDLGNQKIADIIEAMDADDAVDVLEELDEDKQEEIISLLDPEVKEDIIQIRSYEDDEIGSKMTNNYISILNTNSVKEAMKRLIQEAADNDNVSMIYMVDKDDNLIGVLELRELIIARQGTDLSQLIKTNYPIFHAKDKVSDIINEMKEYAMDSYPILDENDKLIGVITSDDVIEAQEEELNEDYAKLAGLTEEEDLDESVFKSVKKRIPWLIILLVLGLIQSFTMSGFDRVVASLPIIVFFQTLVLDMAGNSGTQSLAVTIRLLSQEENSNKKIAKAVFKELRVGMINGLVLGLVSFTFVLMYLYFANNGVESIIRDGKSLTASFTWVNGLKGGSIVGVSLFTAMTVSSFIGAIVPVIFSKIKIDPAVASGPFITTINDIVALLLYYGLAMMLFNVAF
ncbi:MAG: magnesium transporter [Acholeplasmatales bacterium]|nr:magnesium transporter [Acholeplasmatales bacterium]